MNAREYVTLTNSASKRALFPSGSLRAPQRSDDEDSLGHMSPLRSSSPDRYSSPRHSPCGSLETPLKSVTMNENDINQRFAVLEANQKFTSNLREETPQKMFTDIICDTPEKENICDVLSPFKCLIQNRNIEETPDRVTAKNSEVVRQVLWRKTSKIFSSPEKRVDPEMSSFDFNSKFASLIKNSFYKPSSTKARTALFTDIVKVKRPRVPVVTKVRQVKVSFPTFRKRTHRGQRIIPGQINAGVCHKVRRPKLRIKKNVVPKKCTEKPLISPKDRIEKYILENDLLDRENVVMEKPCIESSSSTKNSNDGRGLELKSLSSQVESMNMSIDETEPECPEIEVTPDPTKKFFKTNRTLAIDHKATITVVNNMKIKVHNGKMALNNKSDKKVKPFKKRPVFLENAFEEDAALDTSVVQETVQKVLQKLDSEIEKTPNKPLCVSNTISKGIHDSELIESIESSEDRENQIPPSQQATVEPNETVSCENQPDKAIHTTGTPDSSQKLYPVFYKRKALQDASDTPKKSLHIKKMRLIGENQYQIDAGQSRFRAVNCKECGTLYHLGDPEDEVAHYHIHNNFSTFKFAGWKNEHIVKLYANSERIIVIYPDDPKIWVNKAKDVLAVIDKEMGFVDYHLADVGNNKVYLYVLKNRIIGVLAAEPKEAAHRMLDVGVEGPDCCSEETYPIICGISRIWTAQDKRRKGVASRLVDSLRLSFMFDHILDKKEIAFSVPTDMGKAFATKYMNTPEFMVYYK